MSDDIVVEEFDPDDRVHEEDSLTEFIITFRNLKVLMRWSRFSDFERHCAAVSPDRARPLHDQDHWKKFSRLVESPQGHPSASQNESNGSR
jgi:hypothetical protein